MRTIVQSNNLCNEIVIQQIHSSDSDTNLFTFFRTQYLQYCQEIEHKDIGLFISTPQDTSSGPQSFLFFPALCSADKSEVSWTKPSDNYSIGWLAQCTDPYDYFPPRFLHVLLLRIIYSFTITVPGKAADEHSIHLQRRCTMWKTGVHWLMEEGVECMMEMVDINKGMVVITKSERDAVENCISVFNSIVSCDLERKVVTNLDHMSDLEEKVNTSLVMITSYL